MELVLIRHAHPYRIEEADGRPDPGLDDTGAAQADALGAWSTGAGIDAIWSSPMRRARETAAPMAARLGLDVMVEPDLMEMDRNLDYYIPFEELTPDDPRHSMLIEWAAGKDDASDPRVFQAAVVTAIDRIVDAHPGERVAVVCHGGVINVYAAHVLGLEDLLFFVPRYTGLTRIKANRDGRRSIYTINEAPHLPELD